MKRVKSLFVVLAVFLAFSACTPPETKLKNKNVNTEINEIKVLAPEDITAGFVYIGPINDGGYSESHDKARIRLEKELGINTLYRELVPEDASVQKAIEDMIAEGANVIFSTSFAYDEYVQELALKHKNVKFFQCGGIAIGENLSTYDGKVYQARYLAGMVAGASTKTGKVGYVASKAVPGVIRGINAFALGVKSVNKDALVDVLWTETWYDLEKENAAAQALIDSGVDIITMHQDTNEVALVAERNRVNFISYNTNRMNESKYQLSSIYWDWSVYYIDAIERILSNSYKPNEWWGDISTGVFKIAPIKDLNGTYISNHVASTKKKMETREFSVFKGPILDNKGNVILSEGDEFTTEELVEMDWLVDGVVRMIE